MLQPTKNQESKIKNHNRGGATRTLNLRFWRPLLCQLSYTPSIGQQTFSRSPRASATRARPRQAAKRLLLPRFLMNRVLAFLAAELLQFEPIRAACFLVGAV